MPWHPPCALVRLILPCFILLPKTCFLFRFRLIEEVNHCVLCLSSVTFQYLRLDWINSTSLVLLTLFPCAVFKVRVRPNPFQGFGYAPAGSASQLSSSLVGLPASLTSLSHSRYEVSFPILQNDTELFIQEEQSNRIWLLASSFAVSLPLFLTLVSKRST